MDILFVGSTQGQSTSLFYFTSLVRLGHRVLPWDPKFFQTTSPFQALRQRLRRSPSPGRVQAANAELLSLCKKNRFDLVFVMGENFIAQQTLEAIRSDAPSRPRLVFHSHDNLFASGILKSADFFETIALYDAVFTTKSQNVGRYHRLGQKQAHFIPSAFEPTVHRPIDPTQTRLRQPLQVSFIGTYDRSRLPYLGAVGWERLHVWGNGWERMPGFAQRKDRIRSGVHYFEFADVCSQSRIALGLLREEAEDLHTQRTFEIPATGALQFAPDNEEIRRFFEPDKEIVLFNGPQDLAEKTEYYLHNDTKRIEIARAGYARCLSGQHTYIDRSGAILEHLSSLS